MIKQYRVLAYRSEQPTKQYCLSLQNLVFSSRIICVVVHIPNAMLGVLWGWRACRVLDAPTPPATDCACREPCRMHLYKTSWLTNERDVAQVPWKEDNHG